MNLLKKSATAALLLSGFLGAAAHAETPGVTADKIVFGQSAAFDGPAGALGTGMHQGLMAAFSAANKAGGVNGRMLEIVKYDDGYEPDQAIENTKKLIEQDKVFSIIGAVGTPTSRATQPIATEAKVPFVGPFTGAGFLRDSANSNVINVRATYDQETETWIKHLTEDLGISKIAILYQDDGFGRVGLAGVNKALEKRGMKLVAEGTYQRNTTAVKTALLAIRKAEPEAVVMVGAYKPLAEFIKLSKKLKLDPVFVTISFVGSRALAAELGDQGAGVVISQVVPFPWDSSIPLVAKYTEDLKAYDASLEPGFVSLEGYMVGRLTVMALEKAGKDLSRESFLEAVYGTGTFDLGGAKLEYGPGDNQGMGDVFLSVIQADGSFKSVEKLSK
ncbi:ABC transporter substrate-binding protein [Nisaea sp.]|uniref:ABC transporter substrate-binding protein n=1 Tax=Nisaea sp. TaxID=2024842 RepID=UPI003B5286C6